MGGLLVSVFSPIEQPFKQGGAVGFLVGVVLYLFVRLRRFCFDQVGSDSKSLKKISLFEFSRYYFNFTKKINNKQFDSEVILFLNYLS